MRRDSKKANFVVITRKIKAMEEAHGGAWKVAYADFVTAMMAFFLLLWLLNASTGSQVAGIADYFTVQKPIRNELASSPLEGDFELEGETEYSIQPLKFDSANPAILKLLKNPQNLSLGTTDQEAKETVADNEDNIDLNPQVKAEASRNSTEGVPMVVESSDSNSVQKKSMLIESRKDGLDVYIASEDGVFESGTAKITPLGRRQLAQVNTLIASGYSDVELNIEGHTSVGAADNLWKLSLKRALVAMEWMIENGFDENNIVSVDGFASKNLLDPDNPRGEINDRVTMKFIAFERIDSFDQ